MKIWVISSMLALALTSTVHAEAPVVLELFTSQGCSSCPPADALLQKLSADRDLLPLFFHVDYWDGDGWRDPFSSPGNTARQQSYEQSLHQRNVYTPELVVDGASGMVGSDRASVQNAISAARALPKPIAVTIAPQQDGQLSVVFSSGKAAGAGPVDVWLVTYSPGAITSIRGGENSGRELTSINNVKSLAKLVSANTGPLKPLQVQPSGDAGDRYAVLVQGTSAGPIIGAGSYSPG